MPAFVIATLAVRDGAKMKRYSEAAAPTIAAAGGEMVLRGAKVRALAGAADGHGAAGVIRFPDMAAVERWYGSDAYQALVPLRDEACVMTLTAYEVPG